MLRLTVRVVGIITVGIALATAASCVAESAVLSGRVVVQPEGRPGNGVWVSVRRIAEVTQGFPDPDYNPKKQKVSVYTNSYGLFAVKDLPTGIYEVRVENDSLPNWLAPDSKPIITALVGKKDHSKIRIKVTTLATLTGQVRVKEGSVMRGGRIKIYFSGGGEAIYETDVDRNGNYVAPGLERNVQIVLQVTTIEGLYRRIETTPLQAGIHHLDIEVPSWKILKKHRVEVHITAPRAGDTPLVMDWTTMPPDGASGFSGELSLDSEGSVSFDSPPGVYAVRVREVSKDPRHWQASRFYRVSLEERPPQVFNIVVQEAPRGSGDHGSLSAN